jgi:NAD(P)-dependent dehydrogenase (short-subunit alcohol dehydrogenase family)
VAGSEGRFVGRVAVVTGAARGLGAATAARLAAEGAAVAALDLNGEGAGATAEAIRSRGGRAFGGMVDVADAASVGDAVDRTIAELGPPTVAVNCAGVGRFAHSHEVPVDEWNLIVGVNLTGTFLVCRAVIPSMLDAGGGAIVNIASNAGIRSQPYSAAYCASKAGVAHLSKALADEYMRRGIRVNCVAPGGIDTPLQQEFSKFPEGVDWKAFRKVMTPLGNASPDEIAGVIAFVASDECRYMTGSVVSVDGGLTI